MFIEEKKSSKKKNKKTKKKIKEKDNVKDEGEGSRSKSGKLYFYCRYFEFVY